MNTILNHQQKKLLTTLCSNQSMPMSLSEKAMEGTLSPAEIDMLCEVISNEMMISGIEKTFEPNEYGKELEVLLDAVNRPRLSI